jgi:UDP-N-acetylmuramate dehydrogenase
MREWHGTRLATLTTLRVGGPATRLIEVITPAEIAWNATDCDRRGEPFLMLGGGSNLLVGDGGFDGTVARVVSRGIKVRRGADDDETVVVSVEAGEPWDAFVARAVEEGWVGVEALSGIPGRTGATPIQNVGAYGQEVADVVQSVRTYDRAHTRWVTFAGADCRFTYRDSVFKPTRRYVVTGVTFRLGVGKLGAPSRYAELARHLGVEVGEQAPLADVREAVLALRGSKGMVLDEDDRDTWSAGSFFTNPILDVEQAAALPPDAPRYAQPDGRVKTSAAWLIEHAGFPKGHGNARARLSTKHTLALTNRGTARAEDILALAREVRDGVERVFGIRLEHEPVLVGVSL